MPSFDRRTAFRFLGGAALAAAALSAAPLAAFAADEDLVLSSRYENFKRGTVHSLDPSTRGLVVVWEDLGRVKMKAADLVVKAANAGDGNDYSELKVGQLCDFHWYDYVDFLVAKSSPAMDARAKAMVAQGARLEGIPGTEHKVRLFEWRGLVVRTDRDTNTIYMINPAGGEPDKEKPASGEVIQLPQIRSLDGTAILQTLKPGDMATVVYSVQTALHAKIIR